jgi:hypothetical protein
VKFGEEVTHDVGIIGSKYQAYGEPLSECTSPEKMGTLHFRPYVFEFSLVVGKWRLEQDLSTLARLAIDREVMRS